VKKFIDWPALRVPNRIPKHLQEDGLGQRVQLGKGGTALGSQGFGLVQDLGDAALLGKGGRGISSNSNFDFLTIGIVVAGAIFTSSRFNF